MLITAASVNPSRARNLVITLREPRFSLTANSLMVTALTYFVAIDTAHVWNRTPRCERAAMTPLWERVRALEGQTLSTVSGRAASAITEVTDDHVRVVPRSSGKPRTPIERWRFEGAEALGLATADVTLMQVRRAGLSEFNPTYVAAIIQAAVVDAP